MGHRFVVERDYPGRFGLLKPGVYAIPADISMGDAKAARADGYGRIERDAPPTAEGGGQVAAQPFPPGYEHKEQPADIVPPAPRRGRPRKT